MFHSQNLKKADRSNKLLHGRCWLSWGKERRSQIEMEWCAPSKDIRLFMYLNHYGDDAIAFSISLYFFSFHIGFQNHKLYKLLEKITRRKGETYTNGREIGFYISHGAVSLNLWNDPMEWNSKDPWWWHNYFVVQDVIFGRTKHEREILRVEDVEVPLPEKTYKGVGTLSRSTVKRPRWFSKTHMNVEIKVEEGVPHPGKGTMSYNCGEDHMYSQFASGDSIERGIGEFVGSVLWYRRNYPL